MSAAAFTNDRLLTMLETLDRNARQAQQTLANSKDTSDQEQQRYIDATYYKCATDFLLQAFRKALHHTDSKHPRDPAAELNNIVTAVSDWAQNGGENPLKLSDEHTNIMRSSLATYENHMAGISPDLHLKQKLVNNAERVITRRRFSLASAGTALVALELERAAEHDGKAVRNDKSTVDQTQMRDIIQKQLALLNDPNAWTHEKGQASLEQMSRLVEEQRVTVIKQQKPNLETVNRVLAAAAAIASVSALLAALYNNQQIDYVAEADIHSMFRKTADALAQIIQSPQFKEQLQPVAGKIATR